MSLDLAAQRKILDAAHGPASGDLTVELWEGNPNTDGTQTTGDGYAPGSLPDDGWDAADVEGVKSAAALVECGSTPGEAWPGTVTHVRLVDGGGVVWGSFRLVSPLDVGGAGTHPVRVLPSVFFGDTEMV